MSKAKATEHPHHEAGPPLTPRLLEAYRTRIRPSLMKEFGYTNPLAVPRLEKIVVNMGVGEAVQNGKVLEVAAAQLAMITGQRPILTRAKRSISNFHLRSGQAVGCKVTLRGPRMYEFLDRLVNTALPRIRDFRGLSVRSFDGRGNFALGLREQTVFPEIVSDETPHVLGMDIIIATTARSNREAFALLKQLGLPFPPDAKPTP